MINASDFRNGVTFEMDGGVWTIVSFLHVKPGKGAAFVRTKIKNVVSGAVLERTFNPTEKFQRAYIETKEMEIEWGTAVTPEAIEEALEADEDIKAVSVFNISQGPTILSGRNCLNQECEAFKNSIS